MMQRHFNTNRATVDVQYSWLAAATT